MSTKLVDTECPRCHSKFGTAVDLSEVVIGHAAETERENLALKKVDELDRFVREKLADKPKEEKPKKEDEPILQSHIPGYRCGPECQKVHRNKNHKARIKGRCDNDECRQFSNVDSGPCPWCEDGQIEKVDEDELRDAKIRMPEVHHEES